MVLFSVKYSYRFIVVWGFVLCAQSCPTLCSPTTVAHQAPLSMRFSRQEFWSEWPFPSPVWGHQFSQFSHSVMSDFCSPINRSMPGLPVHHQLLEFTQTHVHQVGDAIQPSYPLFSPSLPALNPSHHQSFPMSHLFA